MQINECKKYDEKKNTTSVFSSSTLEKKSIVNCIFYQVQYKTNKLFSESFLYLIDHARRLNGSLRRWFVLFLRRLLSIALSHHWKQLEWRLEQIQRLASYHLRVFPKGISLLNVNACSMKARRKRLPIHYVTNKNRDKRNRLSPEQIRTVSLRVCSTVSISNSFWVQMRRRKRRINDCNINKVREGETFRSKTIEVPFCIEMILGSSSLNA